MSKKKEPSSAAGQFSFEGLDRVLHEKARLGILTSLLTNPDGLLFTELKELCSLTDGNLSRHIQTLQEAGLLEVWKSHQNRRPQTLVRLTADGRERFLEYIGVLEQIVATTAEAATGKARNRKELRGLGWSPG